MLVLDVDGTLTDGKIYMGEKGEIMKAFNCHDAVGLRKLPPLGIETVILTGRISKIVENRAREMNISILHQNVKNKKQALDRIAQAKNISYDNIAYIGDDENDYEAMKLCGFAACPNDATSKIKEIATYISPKKCNEAAVREIIDHKLLADYPEQPIDKGVS